MSCCLVRQMPIKWGNLLQRFLCLLYQLCVLTVQLLIIMIDEQFCEKIYGISTPFLQFLQSLKLNLQALLCNPYYIFYILEIRILSGHWGVEIAINETSIVFAKSYFTVDFHKIANSEGTEKAKTPPGWLYIYSHLKNKMFCFPFEFSQKRKP